MFVPRDVCVSLCLEDSVHTNVRQWRLWNLHGSTVSHQTSAPDILKMTSLARDAACSTISSKNGLFSMIFACLQVILKSLVVLLPTKEWRISCGWWIVIGPCDVPQKPLALPREAAQHGLPSASAVLIRVARLRAFCCVLCQRCGHNGSAPWRDSKRDSRHR